MKQTYDKEYFIKKFEAIPNELWIEGAYEIDGKCCAYGHCGVRTGSETEEAAGLSLLFAGAVRGTDVSHINDGNDLRYQQPTPRERILAALARELETQLTNTKKEIAMLRETYRTSYPGEDIRAERWHAEQDKARLDWLRHGIKFIHEEGSCGHADLWTVYDEDWSKPLGTGATLREAIDAALGAEHDADESAERRDRAKEITMTTHNQPLTPGATIRIEKCTSPSAWYAERIGQTLKIERHEIDRSPSQGIPEDVYWCRTGDYYNTLNYVRASDATALSDTHAYAAAAAADAYADADAYAYADADDCDCAKENDGSLDVWGTEEGFDFRLRLVLAK